ncbi:nucleotidyltransferase family protein [Psychromonas sp. PT13]|uniref:nucleotidyltransferase family protein n=1 Tax=Psychromonas sp. PT13 TaxID=3439547 RepID=UPI003EBAA4B3
MDKIIALIKQDDLRLAALDCVFQLDLPQCYLAAGFLRNLVWDYLHRKTSSTPLNDIDVIYYDPFEQKDDRHVEYEAMLNSMMPTMKWQVRNQAKMHHRNGDAPYLSCLDAMRYWPEKETAVAIRKISHGHYECVSAFGFESLFNLEITHNLKRERNIFEGRIQSKDWLLHWPKLIISS